MWHKFSVGDRSELYEGKSGVQRDILLPQSWCNKGRMWLDIVGISKGVAEKEDVWTAAYVSPV